MTDGSDYDPYERRGPRERSSRERSDSERSGGDFQRAVERFEKAVQDLVGSATSEFSDRATSFLNDTTTKLERELGDSQELDEDDRYSDAARRMAARRRARARYRSERLLSRPARLCRDDENAKIAGVCAGIANYYGVEHWVVRCIAVSGLLFLSQIVFPAYWIMYFVMDNPDPKKQEKRERRRSRRHRKSRNENVESLTEPQPELSPKRNLRNVQADLQEVELKLRRMESHVTSGQYELQRELHKIDVDDSAAGSASR